MSKLFNIAFFLSLGLMVSNPSVASYHMDEMSGDGSGGGYSSSSGILAVVAVGAIGYVIYKNRNQSEDTPDVSAFLNSQKMSLVFKYLFEIKDKNCLLLKQMIFQEVFQGDRT